MPEYIALCKQRLIWCAGTRPEDWPPGIRTLPVKAAAIQRLSSAGAAGGRLARCPKCLGALRGLRALQCSPRSSISFCGALGGRKGESGPRPQPVFAQAACPSRSARRWPWPGHGMPLESCGRRAAGIPNHSASLHSASFHQGAAVRVYFTRLCARAPHSRFPIPPRHFCRLFHKPASKPPTATTETSPYEPQAGHRGAPVCRRDPHARHPHLQLRVSLRRHHRRRHCPGHCRPPPARKARKLTPAHPPLPLRPCRPPSGGTTTTPSRTTAGL